MRISVLLLMAATSAAALRSSTAISRRALLTSAATVTYLPTTTAVAVEAEENIEVYFGCGCFWHVQHEFVEAERSILGRKDHELTALAGFAGGNAGTKNGLVCYHNALQISDYGSLGHAEVVRLRIPRSSFGAFATEYVKLFDAQGNRPDQLGDRGSEYRNVVGVPGGAGSPLVKELVKASVANGDKLDFANGRGDDPDARAVAFVMDSTGKHPFYQAEVYHQFHDGFNWGENYPDSYNKLGKQLLQDKKLVDQGCPNGLIGIGVAGL